MLRGAGAGRAGGVVGRSAADLRRQTGVLARVYVRSPAVGVGRARVQAHPVLGHAEPAVADVAGRADRGREVAELGAIRARELAATEADGVVVVGGAVGVRCAWPACRGRAGDARRQDRQFVGSSQSTYASRSLSTRSLQTVSGGKPASPASGPASRAASSPRLGLGGVDPGALSAPRIRGGLALGGRCGVAGVNALRGVAGGRVTRPTRVQGRVVASRIGRRCAALRSYRRLPCTAAARRSSRSPRRTSPRSGCTGKSRTCRHRSRSRRGPRTGPPARPLRT